MTASLSIYGPGVEVIFRNLTLECEIFITVTTFRLCYMWQERLERRKQLNDYQGIDQLIKHGQ